MANVDETKNINYQNLSPATKATVVTAIAAIRAANTSAALTNQKDNVRVILNETVKAQEET